MEWDLGEDGEAGHPYMWCAYIYVEWDLGEDGEAGHPGRPRVDRLFFFLASR